MSKCRNVDVCECDASTENVPMGEEKNSHTQTNQLQIAIDAPTLPVLACRRWRLRRLRRRRRRHLKLRILWLSYSRVARGVRRRASIHFEMLCEYSCSGHSKLFGRIRASLSDTYIGRTIARAFRRAKSTDLFSTQMFYIPLLPLLPRACALTAIQAPVTRCSHTYPTPIPIASPINRDLL